VKSTCKDCGGSSVCKHNRLRSVCKLCGGGSICEHGRVRSYCKDCGGGGVCIHNRVRSNCRLCGSAGQCEHLIRRIDCAICGGPCDCGSGKPKSKCVPCRENKKVILASEAARLASQLGVSVPELTIPPTDIPLLASKLQETIAVTESNLVPKTSIRAAKADTSGSSAFQSVSSFRQMPALNPELVSMVPDYSRVGGLSFGSDFGAFEKCSTLDSISMAARMQPVYDMSNALLLAAKAEVESMMLQIAAQNSKPGIKQDFSLQAPPSLASLPLPMLLGAPTFPSMTPAHPTLPPAHAFHPSFPTPAIADFLLRPITTPHVLGAPAGVADSGVSNVKQA
jgi:hypothetical protein